MAIKYNHSSLPQDTVEYELATQVALHLAKRLNSIGVKTVVDTQEKAMTALRMNDGRLSFSTEQSESSSISKDFTGWKVYPQCKKQKERDDYAKDIKDTIWAPDLLWQNDIHVFFDEGKPLYCCIVRYGALSMLPLGCNLKDEFEKVYPYLSAKGVKMPEVYLNDMENLRKLKHGEMTWKEAFMMPMMRHTFDLITENYTISSDFYSWDDFDKDISKKVESILEVSKDERFKEGYYTEDELLELHPDSSKIVAIRAKKIELSTTLPNLEFINSPKISIPVNANVTFPKLKKITGYLTLSDGSVLSVENLKDIEFIKAEGSGVLCADNLQTAYEIHLNDNSQLFANKLEKVYYLYIENASRLHSDALKWIGHWSDWEDNYIHGVNPDCIENIRGPFVRVNSANEDLLQNLHSVEELFVTGDVTLETLESAKSLYIDAHSKLKADNLQSVELLQIEVGGRLESKTLTHVDELIIWGNNAVIDAVDLNRVGKLWISRVKNANIGIGHISMVDEDVHIFGKVDVVLDSIRQINGKLTVGEKASVFMPHLETVKGGILKMEDSVCKFGNRELEESAVVADLDQVVENRMFLFPFHTSNGVVYGYVKGDTIHLTPEGMNPETPIHEYTHLWLHAMRKQSPEEWETLMELSKTLPEWKEVSNNPAYMNLNDERKAEEVLATAVGKDASKMIYDACTQAKESGSLTVARAVEYIQSSLTEYACGLCGIDAGKRTDLTMQVLFDMVNRTHIGIEHSMERSEKVAAQIKREPVRQRGSPKM